MIYIAHIITFNVCIKSLHIIAIDYLQFCIYKYANSFHAEYICVRACVCVSKK